MTHYSEDEFHWTENVGFALRCARELLTVRMDAAVKLFDLKTHHVGIFLALRDEQMTTVALARRLRTDTGGMTRTLDKLEARGMIERTRASDDRRVVRVGLTEKGERMAKAVAAIAPNVLNECLSKFTATELEEFSRLLRKFNEVSSPIF